MICPVISINAEVVERSLRKPCCQSAILKLSDMVGRITRSKILAIGEIIEIGLYPLRLEASLPALGIIMMRASFQAEGIIPVCSVLLKRMFRHLLNPSPALFIRRGHIPSVSGHLELFVILMAVSICAMEI